MSNKNNTPLFSVVIPHRENESIQKTLEALDCAAARAHKAGIDGRYELLSVCGNQPSVQRNLAVREARGEYI